MAAAAKRDLLDLAHDTVATVARRVSDGECSFHCQLLASMFYEAAKGELEQTLATDAQRLELLSAVVEQCDRAAHPRAAPGMVLAQLRTALALLEASIQQRTMSEDSHRPAPKLRLIPGGLSLAAAR